MTTHILVSRYDAADALSISFVTLDRLVKAGKIRATKVGRRVMFQERDLQSFADRQRKESK
jgi:excisionase family DNA binding protein